jgi:hypothetical protein
MTIYDICVYTCRGFCTCQRGLKPPGCCGSLGTFNASLSLSATAAAVTVPAGVFYRQPTPAGAQQDYQHNIIHGSPGRELHSTQEAAPAVQSMTVAAALGADELYLPAGAGSSLITATGSPLWPIHEMSCTYSKITALLHK